MCRESVLSCCVGVGKIALRITRFDSPRFPACPFELECVSVGWVVRVAGVSRFNVRLVDMWHSSPHRWDRVRGWMCPCKDRLWFWRFLMVRGGGDGSTATEKLLCSVRVGGAPIGASSSNTRVSPSCPTRHCPIVEPCALFALYLSH